MNRKVFFFSSFIIKKKQKKTLIFLEIYLCIPKESDKGEKKTSFNSSATDL